MDHYSILDQNSAPAGPQAEVLQSAGQSSIMSVSAAIAAANAASAAAATLPQTGMRFPGEDGGRSLAEMAQSDLDAALQLLADRAQYITGASGAAIALRRATHNDMLCRASAGSNAPELGALLSTEFGLSGESVRTRRTLRCDDTERDPRVNREGCRQLGISSVAVLPIVNDDGVLGVFELFSGKVNAFDERDLSALQRLGDMVETAVKLVTTAGALPLETQSEVVVAKEAGVGELVASQKPLKAVSEAKQEVASPQPAKAKEKKEEVEILALAAAVPAPVSLPSEAPPVLAPPKKPLLWSAASQTVAAAEKPPAQDLGHVPLALRSLRKCQACNFPVSEGRALCVECEEKQWRGQLRYPRPSTSASDAIPAPSIPAAIPTPEPAPRPLSFSAAVGAATAPAPGTAKVPASMLQPATPPSTARPQAERPSSPPIPGPAPQPRPASGVVTPFPPSSQPVLAQVPGADTVEPSPTMFLSGGMAPSQSWFSANKYILAALLVVAGVVAGILLLR